MRSPLHAPTQLCPALDDLTCHFVLGNQPFLKPLTRQEDPRGLYPLSRNSFFSYQIYRTLQITGTGNYGLGWKRMEQNWTDT